MSNIDPSILKGWAGNATKEEGRSQLSKEFKESFREALSAATGEPENAFDFRSLNSPAQTTRATAESMEARTRVGRSGKTWIFLGRVSEKEDSIAETLRGRLGRACSVAVLFSKAMGWKPYVVLHHPDQKALSDKLSAALGLDPSKAVAFADVTTDSDSTEQDAPSGLSGVEDVFIDQEQIEAIVRNLRRKKCIMLSGPPGSGKTFIAERIAALIADEAENASITKVQFHPSYAYEDFVRGWRPSEQGFELVDGTLVRIAENAAEDPDSLHVLLIDEINRANVAKVFGELLSLIEVTKRGPTHGVVLAYRRPDSNEDVESPFYVPDNVYIIGTMNTADRSIAMVDFALRRRFSFFYVDPAFSSAKFQTLLKDAGVPSLFVTSLAQVMNDLNSQIVESGALGKGYEIGHSYFVPPQVLDDPAEWFNDIVETELVPLLLEYWFENEPVAAEWIAKLRNLSVLLSPHGAQVPSSSAAVSTDANSN